MPYYEHVIITRPDISSGQVDEIVENLSKKVRNLGGEVGRTEYWGLRNLAYRINKNRKGHYSLIQIEGPGTVIQELERQHRIDEDVIRYLSIKVDELSDEPSPILAKRDERKKRDRRD